MKISRSTITAVCCIAVVGITTLAALGGSLRSAGAVNIPDGYTELVFCDEFNSAGALDSTKWNFEKGYLRNGELQCYTDKNAFCRDGHLVIELRGEDPESGEPSYTSASISTAGISDWVYGYIEVRAKMPSALGVWSSFKLLPADQVYGDWPRSGELDLVEYVGHQSGQVHFTAHSERYNHVRSTQRRCSVDVPGLADDFHVYGMEWMADCIKWYVDGKERFRLDREHYDDWTTWPFDTGFFLAVNLAYGGSWGGVSGTDDSALPQRLEIDYVRIFK